MRPEDARYEPSNQPSSVNPAEGSKSQLSVLPEYASPSAVASPYGGTSWLEEPQEAEGIQLTSMLHSLRRRWLVATGWGLGLATLLAGILWLLVPERYEAIAYLRIRRESPNIIGEKQSFGTDRDYQIYKQTQANLIRSPFVIAAALRSQGISQLPMVRREKIPVEWLSEELDVTIMTESEIMQVALKGKDKDEIKKIVDAVLNAYREEVVNAERDEQNKILDKLRQHYRETADQHKTKNEDFVKLAQTFGSKDSSEAELRTKLALTDLQGIKQERDMIHRQLREADLKLMSTQASLEAGKMRPSDYAIEDYLETDRSYYFLKEQINFMKEQYQQASAMVRPDSPSLRRMKTQIAVATNELERKKGELTPRIIDRIRRGSNLDEFGAENIIAQLRTERSVLARDYQNADKLYLEQRKTVQEMGKNSVELIMLGDELEILNSRLEEVNKEMNNAKLNLDRVSRVEFLQNADIPNDSDWLFKYFVIGGSAILCFGLTVLGIAFWDYQGKRVNTTKDIDRGTGIRVIGSLPLLDGHGGRVWPFSRMDQQSLEVVLNFSIDSIRASLLYNRSLEQIQVVMVTSAQGQEGRSTVASQLAVSLARSGRRTLLIDGDVRNPQQHFVFGVRGDHGFCDVLRQSMLVDEAVQPTTVEQLWVLAAGQYDQTVMQSLSNDRAKALFGQLRDRFDFVIVDAGPVLTSADPLLLGQYADTTLVSVRRDVSQIPKVYDACDRLRSVGVHIMGAVVNGAGTEIRRNELRIASNGSATAEAQLQASSET